MSFILEGLVLGLSLAFSLGPIFIALTETSIQKGTLAGILVGAGIWVSDILFVGFFYFFISKIKETIESPSFVFWMGLSGAIFLILFGIYLIFRKPEINFDQSKYTVRNYIGFFIKGFTVNTVNPFTFVFWIFIISTYIIGRQISHSESALLLGTILFIIVSSDLIKVFLSSLLRKKLTIRILNYLFNFSGIILIGFGCYMIFQLQ